MLSTLKAAWEDIEQRKVLFIWLTQFFFGMGVLNLVLKPMGINYKDNTLITNTYFILLFLAVAYYYRLHHLLKDKKVQLNLILVLLASLGFILITPWLAQSFPLKESTSKILYKFKYYYPLWEIPISTTKALDILFQQVLLWSLMLKLKEYYTEQRPAIILFTTAFFMLHIPLFYVFGLFSLVFTLPSLLAGLLFSYVLFNYQLGWFFSLAIHQVYYLGAALILRSFY